MGKKEEFLNLRMHSQLMQRIRESAEELSLSLSEYVRFTLARHELEKRKQGLKTKVRKKPQRKPER